MKSATADLVSSPAILPWKLQFLITAGRVCPSLNNSSSPAPACMALWLVNTLSAMTTSSKWPISVRPRSLSANRQRPINNRILPFDSESFCTGTGFLSECDLIHRAASKKLTAVRACKQDHVYHCSNRCIVVDKAFVTYPRLRAYNVILQVLQTRPRYSLRVLSAKL